MDMNKKRLLKSKNLNILFECKNTLIADFMGEKKKNLFLKALKMIRNVTKAYFAS
jgi:hypothetical protein